MQHAEELLSTVKEGRAVEFSPREFIFKYIRYLPWIAFSVALFLILAYIKLRYSTDIYRSSGKILVKDDNPYSRGGEKFGDIFMLSEGNQNINDDIVLLKSTSISRRVVKDLGLQLSYVNKGKIRSTLLHNRDNTPLHLQILSLTDSSRHFSLEVTVLNDREFTLEEGGERMVFGQPFQRKEGTFRIINTGATLESYGSNQFIISRRSVEAAARQLANNLDVKRASDYSMVLELSYESSNAGLARDIVDGFLNAYQASSLEEKRQTAVNTLTFIDNQMDTVRKDLGVVERSLQQFREKERAFGVEEQIELFFNSMSETDKQVTDLEVKLKVATFLHNYISDVNSPYRMAPATLGIDDPSLIQLLSEYNTLQLQHETYSKTMPADNPLLKNLKTAIEKLRVDMLENLNNVRQGYMVALNDLRKKSSNIDAEINTIPGKQKQLLEITRQQKILEELYSFLLQKKLETSISSASTISNLQIVEPANYSLAPVKPNRKALYFAAIFAGLFVPIGVIAIKEVFNDKVSSRADVEKYATAPILGEVGHADAETSLIVNARNRSYVAEQFRILRSNLKYILLKDKKPVILVTSTFSGEGKSFISTNLGAVLAVSGMKTVILEFDIRKPKILKGLGLRESKGITNYIVGGITPDQIIVKLPGVENLYAIPCGPVPPNPAEILLDEKVKELFQYLRAEFDAIIIDTAPVGLVSDALTLAAHADTAVYIVRHGYTYKKQLRLVNELYANRRLPKLSIVINDIRGKHGYYGYGGYGYGYGYASNNGYYYSDEKPGFWKTWKRKLFGKTV